MTISSLWRRATTGALLAALVVTSSVACSPLGPPVRTESVPSEVPADVTADAAPYYRQTLTWEECGGGLQCSSARAPVNWLDPAGTDGALELAIARLPATSAERYGSILINPGGPGASAIDYLRSSGTHVVGSEVLAHYDVVAVDPRGVGHSTPLDCVTDQKLDELLYAPISAPRGSEAWIAESIARNAAFGAECAATAGSVAGHLDTANVARDFDMARGLVGDPALNYFGFSYGTLIGAVYADLFSERVGRMVLDGAMNPAADLFDVTLGQAVGFERALEAYLTDCLSRERCPFSGSVGQATRQVGQLLTEVDKAPLQHSDGRTLNAPTLLTAIIYSLYRSSSWDSLSRIFDEVQDGQTRQAFAAADAYNRRTPTGTYSSNMIEAFNAVTCVDYPHTRDPDVMERQNAALIEAAPTVGPWWTYGSLACAEWPFPTGRIPAPVSAEGIAPVLVIGTTGDAATPYEWAVAVSEQIDNARLVTFEGDVHTAYNTSPCVRDLVDHYFVDGKVPQLGARC